MNTLITLCFVLATVVYFVKAYDFQDSEFNQILSSELEEALDSLNDVPLHPRSRRDEEAAMAMDEKCKKRHRRPQLCCGDELFDANHENEKELFKSCLKEVTGAEKPDHHKKFDLFSCEEVEKRKSEMICVKQCMGQKKGLLAEDGTPKPDELAKKMKVVFAKEAWLESAMDKIISTCLAEAKNATENQVKPTSTDIMVCNPSGMALKHCLFREIQMSCPADQIKDKAACDKFQEKIKKGDFLDHQPHLLTDLKKNET